MSSRLYTGFGQGKGTFEGSLQAFSLARTGRGDLEAGDKVILPQSMFRDISRLRLPLPMLFRIENERRKSATAVPSRSGEAKKPPPVQYCGVMEFSAPDDKCFLPEWMMQNLKLAQGGRVALTSQRDTPKGQWAKLRPHTTAFVDLAAAVGPRELLEVAFRNYSALSVGETLVVDVAGDMHALDIVELRPAGVVCLYGDLDLEVEFAPPKDAAPDAATAAASAPAATATTRAGAPLKPDRSPLGKTAGRATVPSQGTTATATAQGKGSRGPSAAESTSKEAEEDDSRTSAGAPPSVAAVARPFTPLVAPPAAVVAPGRRLGDGAIVVPSTTAAARSPPRSGAGAAEPAPRAPKSSTSSASSESKELEAGSTMTADGPKVACNAAWVRAEIQRRAARRRPEARRQLLSVDDAPDTIESSGLLSFSAAEFNRLRPSRLLGSGNQLEADAAVPASYTGVGRSLNGTVIRSSSSSAASASSPPRGGPQRPTLAAPTRASQHQHPDPVAVSPARRIGQSITDGSSGVSAEPHSPAARGIARPAPVATTLASASVPVGAGSAAGPAVRQQRGKSVPRAAPAFTRSDADAIRGVVSEPDELDPGLAEAIAASLMQSSRPASATRAQTQATATANKSPSSGTAMTRPRPAGLLSMASSPSMTAGRSPPASSRSSRPSPRIGPAISAAGVAARSSNNARQGGPTSPLSSQPPSARQSSAAEVDAEVLAAMVAADEAEARRLHERMNRPGVSSRLYARGSGGAETRLSRQPALIASTVGAAPAAASRSERSRPVRAVHPGTVEAVRPAAAAPMVVSGVGAARASSAKRSGSAASNRGAESPRGSGVQAVRALRARP